MSQQLDFVDVLFAVVKQIPAEPHKRRVSEKNLSRYSGLRDIPEDEWDEFFPNTDSPWTTKDVKYLLEWWGKDDIMSLSYALGRPPWNLQRVVCRLRSEGYDIPYLRGENGDVDETDEGDVSSSRSRRSHSQFNGRHTRKSTQPSKAI